MIRLFIVFLGSFASMVIFWVLIVLMAAAILFVIGYPAYLYWHYRKYGKWPKRERSDHWQA